MHQVEFVFSRGDFVLADTGEIGPVLVAGAEGENHRQYLIDVPRGRLWFGESRLTLTDSRPIPAGAKWERPLNLREILLTEAEFAILQKVCQDAKRADGLALETVYATEFLATLGSAMEKLAKLTTKGSP